MGIVFRLEEQIGRWTRAIASAGFLVLVAVALLATVDVLLRWIANAPIKGLHDINGLAIVIVIASCFPLVIAQRRNISIRFLGESLGAPAARWLDAAGSGALLAFVALIGWQLMLHTVSLAESSRTTWHLRIAVAPYWTIATAVVLLCIPAQAVAFLADVLRAATDEPPSWRTSTEDGDGADRT
ncbi:MAG TPA: TRAP transporter small permease subunit [Burkholderiales bacterium]|nr:TRAP transporter small permease subunit [Burkholderiales bacterium]